MSFALGAPAADIPAPLFVVGDVHGHLDELLAALYAHGLIDATGTWSGGNARLWFLGDFTDRGPDGVGVIELAMRLTHESAHAGGMTRMLLGNHEVLLLGAYHVPDYPVPVAGGTTTFREIWLRNGGLPQDMERLTESQANWLAAQRVAAVVDDHLLLHADTTAYLEYGDTVEEIDGAVGDIMATPNPLPWWELFRNLTKRGAFTGDPGPMTAGQMLNDLGGRRIVHGHTPIPYQTGEAPQLIAGPRIYAEGQAINLDGGIYLGGPCLIAQLPILDPPGAADDTLAHVYDLGEYDGS